MHSPKPWQSELAELEREYRLEHIGLSEGNQQINLVKVANIDELLDRVTDEDQIPFWAELWPASIGFTRFILENNEIFQRQTILELGSGVGLAGIAAKMAGGNVTFSDFLPEAFRFIRVNCGMNGLPVGELLLADWRRFPESQPPVDMIIGTDILYEKTLHDSLWTIFKRHLKVNGSIWLADPGRDYARQFIENAGAKGWVSKTHRISIQYQSKDHLIQIYQLQLGGNCSED